MLCPSICLGLVGSFSYTPRDGICFVVRRLGRFSNTRVGWGVSLTRPVLKSVCSFIGLHAITLETVSLVGGWRVYVKRPVINSVWSFVG